jgi:hypothetical protein
MKSVKTVVWSPSARLRGRLQTDLSKGGIGLNRRYISGLLTGSFLGAALGVLLASRQQSQRKLLRNGKMEKTARKAMDGLSRGVSDILHR